MILVHCFLLRWTLWVPAVCQCNICDSMLVAVFHSIRNTILFKFHIQKGMCGVCSCCTPNATSRMFVLRWTMERIFIFWQFNQPNVGWFFQYFKFIKSKRGSARYARRFEQYNRLWSLEQFTLSSKYTCAQQLITVSNCKPNNGRTHDFIENYMHTNACPPFLPSRRIASVPPDARHTHSIFNWSLPYTR